MSETPRSIMQFGSKTIIRSGTSLRCCLLGTCLFSRDEKVLSSTQIPLRRARDLLKLLALAPNHRMHREQLIELLWPEHDPEAAAHSLSQTLYTLRAKLAELGARLQFEEEWLVFNAGGGITTDVEDFEQAARSALGQVSPMDSSAAARCQDAIAAYTGDLLPEDGASDLFYQQREALRQLYLSLLLRLADYYLQTQEYIPAIDALQKLLAMDPANEDAHARLMRALALSGQRQAALRQYQVLEEALRRELDVSPSPESQLIWEQIRAGVLAPAQPAFEWLFTPQHNLPAQVSSFIGREEDIAQVRALVLANRLVTLTGAGGVGKTRLAIKTAESLLEEFAQGVFWVELAALSNPDLVAKAVIEALHLPAQDRLSDLDRLIHFFGSRRVLLLLDNCEHLAAACAGLAEVLLKACPDLYILATSRSRLSLPGEVLYRVPSLSFPDPDDAHPLARLGQFDAVRLFTERSSLTTPGFRLTPGNAPAVARICQRLDGIPLALELAAARSRLLSPGEIAGQLERAFRLLGEGGRAAAPRQRTLRASMDWSYALLRAPERLLLQRLSVFSGGWDFEAAEAVTAGEGIDPDEVLNLLGVLVDHSLVVADTQNGQEARFSLLESVRQYGLERLAESGDEVALYRRHLGYYLRLAERADQGVRGPEQMLWIGRLKREQGNLDSAFERSLTSLGMLEQGIRLACALAWYLPMVGDFPKAGYYLRKALSLSASLGRTSTRAAILFSAASTSSCGGSFFEAREELAYLEESLSIWRELGQGWDLEREQARLLAGFVKKINFGDEQGQTEMEDCRRIFHELGSAWWEAWSINLIVYGLFSSGDIDGGYALLAEESMLWQKAGDPWGAAVPLQDRAVYAIEHGDFTGARRWLLDSLAIYEQIGVQGMAIQVLRDLGHIARVLGEYDQADMYYQTCEKLAPDLGWENFLPFLKGARGKTALRRGDDWRAAQLLGAALLEAQKLNLVDTTIYCIGAIAGLAAARQAPALAVQLFGAFTALLQANILKPSPFDRLDMDYSLALCRAQCEKAVFDAAWDAGQALTLAQAAACALELAH